MRARSVLGWGLIGNFFVMWYSKDLVALDTIDFWVGTFFILIVAGIQIVAFGWIFGVDKGLKEAHEGSNMRIPAIFGFIMKYVSPTFLLVVVAGFCIFNAPGYVEKIFADTETSADIRRTWILMLSTIGALALLVTVGAKRWRAQGLDLDGARGADDGVASSRLRPLVGDRREERDDLARVCSSLPGRLTHVGRRRSRRLRCLPGVLAQDLQDGRPIALSFLLPQSTHALQSGAGPGRLLSQGEELAVSKHTVGGDPFVTGRGVAPAPQQVETLARGRLGRAPRDLKKKVEHVGAVSYGQLSTFGVRQQRLCVRARTCAVSKRRTRLHQIIPACCRVPPPGSVRVFLLSSSSGTFF